MKIQLKRLHKIYPSLKKLFDCESLPVLKRWKIRMLAKVCNDSIVEFGQVANERRKSLGSPNDEGGFNVKKENIEMFYNEIKEFENQEIELPEQEIILVNVDIEKAKLTAHDLGAFDELSEIIKIDVTEPAK